MVYGSPEAGLDRSIDCKRDYTANAQRRKKYHRTCCLSKKRRRYVCMFVRSVGDCVR